MKDKINRAFQSAVLTSNPSEMQTLLDAGADINDKNQQGETPLLKLLKNFNIYNHEAYLTQLQWLLQHGADPNSITSSGLSPLQQAIHNIQHVPSDFKEMEYSAAIFPHDKTEYDTLISPEANIFRSIQLLIQYGADIQHIDGNGLSILETALSCKHRETIRYLLSQEIKFDIHQFNPDTSMTLFQFTRACCRDVLPDLLAKAHTINDKISLLFTEYSAHTYPCQYQTCMANEILYLNHEDTHQWRILPWRQGFSFQRFESGHWVDAAHHCEIALLYYRKYWYHTLNTNVYIWLQQQVPADIIERTENYEFGQPLMLHWIATLPYARQITEHSIQLLWLLAGLYTKQPEIKQSYPIHEVLTWPQRKIIQLLGGRGSKSELSFLRRIHCEPGTQTHWNVISKILKKNSIVHLVRHFENIPVELLKAILLYPWITDSNRLMKYYINHPIDLKIPEKMVFLHQIRDDTAKIGHLLNIENSETTINHCQHPDQIHQLHQRWLTRLLKRITPESLKELRLSQPFPSPPIPGNHHIKHIADGLRLMQESLNMEHCVSIYMEQAYTGKSFFYHVEHGNPATLELRYDDKKNVRLYQVMAKNNRPPCQEVKKIVKQWRKQHHIKKLGFSNDLLTQNEIDALLAV